MVELKDIYSATDGGKQIILDLVPQATETKNFSYRPDDSHPSARLYPPKDGRDYWVIKDFGAEGESLFSPVDVFMQAKGMPQTDFHLAVQMLAEMYGVSEQLNQSVNSPRIEKRQAQAGEHDGDHPFKLNASISDSETKIWGRNVKPEHLSELGWSSAEMIASVKNGMVTERYSTANYPIFIQSNHFIDKSGNENTFYKVYQPFAVNQQWRFYTIGSKPQDYVFGMDALQRHYNLNDQQPLDAVAIVSGGSDAVNCLAMGIQPVWLNSETEELKPAVFSRLRKMAKEIYAVYDCDDTGKAMLKRLALQYLDIKAVWLPEDILASLHDKRGHKCKDLKDYLQVRPSQHDFDNLFRQARPARFWDMWKVNDAWKVSVSLHRLCYFLWLNGYVVLRDPLFKDTRYIHIEGIIVEEVTLADIQRFVKGWMIKQALPDMVIDKVMRSRDMTSLLGNNMEEVELDFTSATPTTQWFYLQNCCLEVSKDSIVSHKYNQMPSGCHYVWKDNIIKHNYVPHDSMFTIKRQEDGGYSIDIHSLDSEVFCFLINASRNYWRKEMESRFDDDLEAKAEYARTHKFCINGEGLDETEVREQMQSLVNKIFAVGHMFHRYKMMSRAWGLIVYDDHIGVNGECNGRTGKSLFGKIIRSFMPTVTIEAKSRDITERQFLYAKVTYNTDFLFVDECHKNMDFDHFYARITDDFQVEKKGCDPEIIPFSFSPKVGLFTNFINKKQDASSQARELPVVYSDYYHQRAKNNDYLEDRSVADDFGHNLIDDQYQGWEHDIAFIIECEQFYLGAVENGEKILPPLANIQKRQQLALMGDIFQEWADDYYQVGGGHLDVAEKFDEVYFSYRKEAQSRAVDPDPFNKKLQGYCDYADHIAVFNPKDITGNDEDGKRWRKHETSGQVRYIYVRSKTDLESKDDATPANVPPVQAEIDFDPFAAALDSYDDDETF